MRNILSRSFCLVGIFLCGCATGTPSPTPTATLVPATETAAPQPTATFTPSPQPTATDTPTPDPSAGFNLSSPLQFVELGQLQEIVSNEFVLPSPGMDDGHHGTDFSYYSFNGQNMMEGTELYSMMPGRVAGITIKGEPYGNAVIIETPLTSIPPDFLAKLSEPVQMTPYPFNSRLENGCESLKTQSWTIWPESIYLMYGHLKEIPPVTLGQQVKSGELIGLVGNTGNSGNPHLHLEMRWGPGGTNFASMSHYDGSATDEQRLEYCTWRISGKYVMMDPMEVITTWLNQ